MSITILRGGRVIDPASGIEAVADVVVRGGRVASVSPVPLDEPEATVIDVTGLVVGPGFVDLHCHAQSIAGQRLQAFDGVTIPGRPPRHGPPAPSRPVTGSG